MCFQLDILSVKNDKLEHWRIAYGAVHRFGCTNGYLPTNVLPDTLSYSNRAKYPIFHNCIPRYINETFLALNVQQYARCGPLLYLEAGINGLVVT